jgi:hypothetical protein
MQPHARVQKGQFAQAVFNRFGVEIGLGKGVGRWPKGHLRPLLPFGGGAHHRQRGIRLPM